MGSWQKSRFHSKLTHTQTFTLACTLPLAVIITLQPLSDSVYWLSGQGPEVLSRITAAGAKQDSINVKLINRGGGDFKMSFVVAGQIKWTCAHLGE